MNRHSSRVLTHNEAVAAKLRSANAVNKAKWLWYETDKVKVDLRPTMVWAPLKRLWAIECAFM